MNRLVARYGLAFDARRMPFLGLGISPGLISQDCVRWDTAIRRGEPSSNCPQAIADGRLDLDPIESLGDEPAMERLLELRGVGRWTAEYALLRGLGRTHVFPGDDVGGRQNLGRWLHLRRSLDYRGVHRVLSRWKPYGGLIYFHLLLQRLDEAGHFAASIPRISRVSL